MPETSLARPSTIIIIIVVILTAVRYYDGHCVTICLQDDEKYCPSMHKEVYYKGEYIIIIIINSRWRLGWPPTIRYDLCPSRSSQNSYISISARPQNKRFDPASFVANGVFIIIIIIIIVRVKMRTRRRRLNRLVRFVTSRMCSPSRIRVNRTFSGYSENG